MFRSVIIFDSSIVITRNKQSTRLAVEAATDCEKIKNLIVIEEIVTELHAYFRFVCFKSLTANTHHENSFV